VRVEFRKNGKSLETASGRECSAGPVRVNSDQGFDVGQRPTGAQSVPLLSLTLKQPYRLPARPAPINAPRA
jgi:hypothetical protein